MNIIYARMAGYDWVSVPSDGVVRALENLGHTITICEHPELVPTGNHDFIWSPYESVVILGDYLKQKLKIPHISHCEWIPPWRCLRGVALSDTVKNFEETFQQQKIMMGCYKSADFRTLSSPLFVSYMEKAFGKLNIDAIRYQSVDVKTLEKAKKTFNPAKQQNRVISISRAVPNKRYDLLVEVMNKVSTPIDWVIIGEGPELQRIEKSLHNSKVNTIFLGPKWGWSKLYEIMKSKVFLGAWTGMPQMESAYLNTTPISIEPNFAPEIVGSMIKDLYGNAYAIFLQDKIQEVAGKLEFYLTQDCSEQNTNMVNLMLDNKIKLTTCEDNAKQLIKWAESVCL